MGTEAFVTGDESSRMAGTGLAVAGDMMAVQALPPLPA